jgi:signal transduction histidine kinase
MTDNIKVLYIDDEDNNLNSFKASLRKDFKVITASDAFEGLKIAETEELHVVIADQRMPGLDGVEFFEKLMIINPEPVRILLTGYSDIASVIDAINRGQVYRFIDKPWNIEQIKNAIKTAGDIYFARKELKDKNERLQKIQSEMNQFVYSLSHELRGPLMSISGVSKLAKMEVKDPSVLEYFELIDTATDKLDEFIYKMLDFYRSTKIENKVIEIDFKEVLSQQNTTFNSDDSKIRVILNNLFHNAVVFQKENYSDNTIQLSINVAENIATITVEDNGVGIEDKLINDVFNLFQRATQKNVGSGLGLYMVKESAIQMGGKVQLDSTVDVGTKVTVMLPSLIPGGA